jgi:glycine/D-amino acid oxidase-like deaminating enzyme
MKLENQGDSGWYGLLDGLEPPCQLEDEQQAEWIVIGAGCCGLAVTHRLAEQRPDDRIVLLEGDRVGAGSSGRNSGFMINAHMHGIETNTEQMRAQFKLWDAGVSWLRDTVRDFQIQCDWSDWGRMYVAVGAPGREHLDVLKRRFGDLNYDFSSLDAPAMQAATGTLFYTAGVHMPGSALVQPAALMRGLASHLPINVGLYEATLVTSITRGAGQWRVQTASGVVSAPRIILAAGAHTPELGFFKHRMAPLMLYASLTRPLYESERAVFADVEEFGLLPTSANGSTVRLTRDGRILMRNTTRYAGRGIEDGISAVRKTHREAIAMRWPHLAGIDLEHTWGGVMAVTRNGGVLFGEVGDGAYAIMTTDVSPVARGTIAGRLLADYILGQPSELLDMQLSLATAKLVPPEPFLGWVARHRLAKLESSEAGEV